MNKYSYYNWISLEIPDNWSKEEHDNIITIYDNDGFGALNISFVNRNKADDDYRSELTTQLEMHASSKKIDKYYKEPNITDFEGYFIANTEYLSGEDFWRIWYLLEKDRLVFVTYNCLFSVRDKERKIIDSILRSIEFLEK